MPARDPPGARRKDPFMTSITAPKTPALGGGRAWLVWTLAVVFVVWLFNVQTGYAILNSRVSNDIGLSIEQVGMIAAVYTWVFAIAQLFSGALLDRLGSRKVLLPAIALMGIGVFLFASAESFGMLLLSQVVLALGACAGFVGAGYIGGVWFGMAKFGVMFGLVQLVAALSSAFGAAAFDAALSVMSWRELMMGFGVFGVLLFGASLMFLRNPVEPDTSGLTAGKFVGDVTGSMMEVLKNPQVMLIAVQGAITFGAMLAMGVVWGPKLAIAHGLDESSANLATACLWLGLAAGSPLINKWSNAIQSRKSPILLSTIAQLALIAAAIWMPMTAALAMVIYFLFGLANAGHMLNFTAAADNVPPRLIGTSASIVNGMMFVLGGALMGLPGKFLEGTTGDLPAFQNAMLVFVGLMAVATVMGLIMKECFPKHAD